MKRIIINSPEKSDPDINIDDLEQKIIHNEIKFDTVSDLFHGCKLSAADFARLSWSATKPEDCVCQLKGIP